MSKTKKNELEEAIKRYAVANSKKKAIAEEVSDIGDEIKELMGEADIETYEVNGIKATVSMRVKRTLDVKKIERLLGRPIPEDCYKLAYASVLNVKAA